TAGGEIEPHENVAGRHERNEGGGISGSTRVWLHICKFTSEKLGNPFNRQSFRFIHILAAAIVAPSRQPLGVFIGEYRPLRLKDRFADDVFRGNEFDLVALATKFAPYDLGHLTVGLVKRRPEQVGSIGAGSRRIGHERHAVLLGYIYAQRSRGR